MNKFVLAIVSIFSASLCAAQSLSSFQTVTGLSNLNTTVSGNTLTVAAGASPTFILGSTTYTITEVFGAWLLDSNDDFTATGTNQLGFNFHSNYSGTGGIAGWKTNPNSGFVNDTKAFNYSSMTGLSEDVGYHVRTSQNLPGGANTLYIRNAPVPEPGTMSALVLGVTAMIRRRKR